ncbi:MAG: hypothetical protein ACRD3Q_07400 [Terriglobales bacterium]
MDSARPRTCAICGTRLDTEGNHWDVGPGLGVRAARTITHYRAGDVHTNLVDSRVRVTEAMVTMWLKDRGVLRQCSRR